MRTAAFWVALLLAALPAFAQQGKGCQTRSACRAECQEIKRDIQEIQARMRQGYGAAQGAKMEARLRELRKSRAKVCR